MSAPVPFAPDQEQAQQQAPSLRSQYADWPQKGDQREQPWDLDALGVPNSDRELEPGTPNTVSPVVIRHSYPLLASGSAGAPVAELAARLHLLGYATDIAEGKNPFSILTTNVMSAVERFREEHNVREDPTAYGGDTEAGRRQANEVVGPYTWEALLRASERARA